MQKPKKEIYTPEEYYLLEDQEVINK